MTRKLVFNRLDGNSSGYELGGSIEQPTQDEIKNTPSLHNASLDDAIKYGGELTRKALSAMNLSHKRKHIIVDTKVHMLMPSFSPAISGWHTDGVPRGDSLSHANNGLPNIHAQTDVPEEEAPIYHLLVTGGGCLTKFLLESNIELDVPAEPDASLYSMINHQVQEKLNAGELHEFELPTCRAVKWNWWELHSAQPAKLHEWRFLIRVTETDFAEPKSDLRDIIRTQQQVYLPHNFGW